MRKVRNGNAVKLWLSANDTWNWATRPGQRWACSELSGKRLFVELDDGDLVDIAVNGKDSHAYDVSADELNAIVEDHLND